MSAAVRPKKENGIAPLSNFRRFRDMLTSPQLEFIMEAHNGLSAKIVAEAGFKGIWASGLSMSAALGVRDNNEASWTQILEVLEFMVDASELPILVDGDTGWGNFNNLRRAVKKMCQRGIAGICIEDKLFPKTNSFIGDGQPLADIDEFCGKIKAGKDSQLDDDFSIVARLEALIAGRGMEEALRRAEAYHDAGADAVLIHSKKSTADEVLEFTKEWANRCPVVIVPTKYYSTPTDEFRNAGISLAIWANHNLRTSIAAMRETTARIHRDQSLAGVENSIVSVSEVFALQGADELKQAEDRYLTKTGSTRNAVVVAATRGKALGALTEDRPKCMVEIRNKPLLTRLVNLLRESGVQHPTVVRGYKKEMVNLPAIETVDNDFFETTGQAASLACAAGNIKDECIIAHGDILFRQHYLDELFATPGDIVIAVDGMWADRNSTAVNGVRNFVRCSHPFGQDFIDEDPVIMQSMSKDMDRADISGEWIGLARVSGRGAGIIRDMLQAMQADGSLPKADLRDLFTRIAAAGHDIHVHYVAGQWLDVDDLADVNNADRFL
ncbi:MAG: phosphoenolpyruvate mutase [Rhodospirillales bacterium]|nr:phosphoenolpyruvate mutase [Rhodospirillales bacterium]